MLKEGAAPPAGKWADLQVLEPVRDFKARHASTLLTFDAVVDALDRIEAKRVEADRTGTDRTEAARAAPAAE
jgi:NifU-like protein involved in Fe-S cluster formation